MTNKTYQFKPITKEIIEKLDSYNDDKTWVLLDKHNCKYILALSTIIEFGGENYFSHILLPVEEKQVSKEEVYEILESFQGKYDHFIMQEKFEKAAEEILELFGSSQLIGGGREEEINWCKCQYKSNISYCETCGGAYNY